MKHDTSFTRVIFITLFCLVIFPFFYQTIAYYQQTRLSSQKLESMEVFSEYSMVMHHINRYVIKNNRWPESLNEANYLSNEQLLHFDLSESWTLLATVNHKSLNEELWDRKIKFLLDSTSNEWRCDRSITNIPQPYTPKECAGELNQFFNGISARTWFILTAIAAIIIIALLAIYRHPLLKVLRKNHFILSKTPYHQLKKLYGLSLITGHQKPILKANNLTLNTWQSLVKSMGASATEKIRILMQSLPFEKVSTESKHLFRLTLSDQFELNINELLIWVVPNHKNNTIIKRINHFTDQTTPLLLWVSDPATHIDLRTQSGRINRPFLIPSQQQMTQLMLFNTARSTLVELAAKNIPINIISPYQSKGGITKSSHFFGRTAILDKIENQVHNNFLLVGGRQLGKTSLLKALNRKLTQQPNSQCIYLSLSDDRLLPRLAYHSQIKQYIDLEDLLRQIQHKHPNKLIRLLIDEADLFIQSEVDNNFQLLNQIRNTAEQKPCQFIFAGFWQLYAHAVIDYQSPLRNLAHTITVGPLEQEPGHQLITQPMKMLGQRFTSDQLVHEIYQQSGGRANLINMICEYLVEQLASKQQPIDNQLVNQAVNCDQVQDALEGWTNLTSDPHACSLDRFIIYLTFIHLQVDLKIISESLTQYQLAISSEQLKQSLQRLRLAHILIKQKTHYLFAIPLFAQQLTAEEASVFIAQEVQILKS